MSLEKSDNVKDWKRRKATNANDPFDTIRKEEASKYNYVYDGKYYQGKVVVGSHHVISSSNRIVVANQRYYFPISDVNSKFIKASKKRWRWARGEQIWYSVKAGSVSIKNCAWVYPDPITHQYVKNHITFQSKSGLSVIDIQEVKSGEGEINNDSLVSKADNVQEMKKSWCTQ